MKYWKILFFFLTFFTCEFFSCDIIDKEDEDESEKLIEWTIEFLPNGGSIDSSLAIQTVTYKPTTLKTAEQMKLHRSGYTFLGWAETSNGKLVFNDGETIEIWNTLHPADYSGTNKISLWAIWQVTTLSITFEANGGEITVTEQGISEGQTTALKSASSLGLSRTGYSFLGWAETADATQVIYTDAQNISFSKSMILYAIWKENPRHTITFNGNGGTIKSESQSIVEQVPTALTSADELELSREGYIFAGWGKNSDDTTATYTDGQEITLPANSSDLTLYALWAQQKEYKIYFYKNGGSFADASTADIKGQIVSGESITGELPAKLNTKTALKLSRSGYIFNGWATDSASGEVVFADGQELIVSEDIQLYAIWEESRNYTITYDANGGSILNSLTATETIEGRISGEEVKLKTAIALNLNRQKYLFAGWATNQNAGSAEFANGSTITVKDNITLYAVWYLPTYTITYQSVNTRVQRNIEGYGEYATLPTASSLGLSNGDSIFLGWSTSGFATTATYKAGQQIEITSNLTLYAVWQANCIYVRLYHPGYSTSNEKYHTIAFTIGSSGSSKLYLVGKPRYLSYTTSYETIFPSGSMAWATSFSYTKGTASSSVQQSGYTNFKAGGYYQINIKTGAVTKVK